MPLTASKDVHVPLGSTMVIKRCPHAAGDSFAIWVGEAIVVAVDELKRRCPVGTPQCDVGSPSSLDVSGADNKSHLSFGLRRAI